MLPIVFSVTQKYDATNNVLYRFVSDGVETFLEYHDSRYGDIRHPVPAFMTQFSGVRLGWEVKVYLESGGRWSDRLLMELFYYGVTYGLDHDPDPEARKDRPHKGLEGARNWLNESVSVCEWEGIVCGEIEPPNPGKMEFILGPDWRDQITSKVGYKPPPDAITQIDLPDRLCEGTLASEIALLEHIHRINLHHNYLRGTIPTEFGRFSSLTHLDLGDNELTGTIPSTLSQLEYLEGLWLEQNKLEGAIHYGLSELRWCLILDLSQNRLSGTIPPELERMSSLIGLYLEHNMLTGTVLHQIGNIRHLMVLELGHNRLTGTIPTELGQLPLQWLHLSHNQLNGTLPVQVLRTNLNSLQLASNQLSGTIPAGHDGSSKNKNKNNGFAWSALSQLTYIVLEDNQFQGTLAPSFLKGIGKSIVRYDTHTKYTRGVVVFFSFSSLTFFVCGMRSSLQLGYNRLRGTIPTEIGRLTRLSELTLSNNDLGGTLPKELGMLPNLQSLNLTANK